MTICNSCGNDYSKTFEIVMENKKYNFDCFECAIAKLAPICQNYGCKIIGHGIESEKFYFCCSHCARRAEIISNEKMPSKSK